MSDKKEREEKRSSPKFTNEQFVEMIANDREGYVPADLREAARKALEAEDPVAAFKKQLGI